jgi:hypothetical protein
MTRRRSIGRGAVGAVCAAFAVCTLSIIVSPIAAASTRRIHLTITLRPRDPVALARAARAVSTPGTPAYRRYLSPRAFGARYGAEAATITTVTRALQARGLDPGRPSAGGLSIPLTVPASALPAAGTDAAGAARSLVTRAVPRSARGSVQTVIAFGRSSAARPLALRDPVHRSEPLSGMLSARQATGQATSATGPQPCAAAVTAAAGVHANTASMVGPAQARAATRRRSTSRT